MDAADRHVLDSVPVALQVWEADRRASARRWANAAAGSSALPADVEPLLEACEQQAAASVELRDGETFWRAQMTPLGDRRMLVAFYDITAQKAHEQSLRASEVLNREILSGLQEGVIVIDTDARIVVANEAAGELLGVPVSELMDRPLSGVPVDLLDDRGHLLPSERLPLMRALRDDPVTGLVVRFVRRDGSLLWVEVHSNPLHDADGKLYGAVASYDDVTARVEQDRRVRHEADHDPLTGPPHRRAPARNLDAALARAGARARSVGIVMLDLDGFKAIN